MDIGEFETTLIKNLFGKIDDGCISEDEKTILGCYWDIEVIDSYCDLSKKNPKNYIFRCDQLPGFWFAIIQSNENKSTNVMVEKNSKEEFFCSECKLITTEARAVRPHLTTYSVTTCSRLGMGPKLSGQWWKICRNI